MNTFFQQHKTALLVAGFVLAILGGLGLGYVMFKPDGSSLSEDPAQQAHEAHADETTWTCSMHPQIRQDEPGDCPICGMDLIPLDRNTSSDPLVLEMTPAAVKLAQIETTVLGAGGQAENTLTLSGKIQADERLASSQVAHIPGRIEQLYVAFKGEYVAKGQRVARIYAPELITAQQELIQAMKLKDRNPGLYAAARQKLAYWKLTEAQIAGIEQSQAVQETFDLHADAAGVVTNRRVAVGDYVRQGEGLFDLMNLSRVWVLFDAYEEDLPQLAVGDPIEFTTPAVPGKTFSTRISFIDPVIDPQTRVASIRAEVSNAGRLLKPEMFVTGVVASAIKGEAQLLVPKSAVLWTGTRSVVYVQVPDMRVPSYRYQEIELGERVGDAYLVNNGLQSGDEVVTHGNFVIDAAAQLNNQASMMNRQLETGGAGDAALPDYTRLTPAAFQQQLDQLVAAYLPLKDALVASDPAQAQTKAQGLLDQLSQLDMAQLQGDLHDYWMTQARALKGHAEAIASQEALAAQRDQFSFLSTTLIETVRVMGITGKSLYVQHCPMARDYEGADWLSRQEEIRNPYFGDQMLSCGSVTGELTAPAAHSAPAHQH